MFFFCFLFLCGAAAEFDFDDFVPIFRKVDLSFVSLDLGHNRLFTNVEVSQSTPDSS